MPDEDHIRYVERVQQLLAARLDALREERSITVNWLADFSGISRGNVSKILRGTGNPSVKTLALLANAMGVPFGSLFDFEEPFQPGPRAEPRPGKPVR